MSRHMNHIQTMLDYPSRDQGMDVVIVSTSTPQQQKYWQQRLESTRRRICKPSALILVTLEDWEKGAGNGLGTLYAWLEAKKMAEQRGFDLEDLLVHGASIAMYHTAGKGTRLAPLPGSEGNNKSGVKLPCILQEHPLKYLTLLEAVIRQTALFAPVRKGRLSVFWGDQIFIPSTALTSLPKGHVDLFCRSYPIPTEEQWEQGGFQKYGLLLQGKEGGSCQLEKLSYQEFLQLTTRECFTTESLGLSLGCFNLSPSLLLGLLCEFQVELQKKNQALDSDPHFWMPLTLPQDLFLQLRGEEHPPHFERMQNLKASLSGPIMTQTDIGADAYWWDYGTLQDYLQNTLKVTEQHAEGKAMRRFFEVHATPPSPHLDVDEQSLLSNCTIQSGTIRNSVLIGVEAQHVNLKNAVVIHSQALGIHGSNCLLYNACDTNTVELAPREVRADVMTSSPSPLRFHTSLDRDGKTSWTEKLPHNPLSFAELYQHNVDSHQKQTFET